MGGINRSTIPNARAMTRRPTPPRSRTLPAFPEAEDLDRAGSRAESAGAALQTVGAADAATTVSRLPAAARPRYLLGLQRTAGNAAVQQLLRSIEPRGLGGPGGIALLQRLCVKEAEPGTEQDAGGSGGGGLAAVMQAPAEVAGSAPVPAAETAQNPPPGAPANPPPGARPMVSFGSTGPDVIDLQTKLNADGATPPLATDGIFGPKTRAAVVTYQGKHKLTPDGIVGPKTWGELDKGGGGGGGGGGGTQPPQKTLPIKVVGHSASPAAVAAAQTSMDELFRNLTAASEAQLMTNKVECHVIPHDKKMTDLPPFAHLKGTKTFDGRLWDDVRGIQTTLNGVVTYAIAEEDLVPVPGKPSGYGPGFLGAHEGGHAIQSSSMTPAQITTLTNLYTTRLAASGPITPTTPAGPGTAMWLSPSWYSAANKEEYFGNSVAAYFGHPYSTNAADVAMYTRAWLQTNDPGMHTLLATIYQ